MSVWVIAIVDVIGEIELDNSKKPQPECMQLWLWNRFHGFISNKKQDGK